MKKKQFKTESKRLLDLMINSIYTHKEIFLRELISNASDAIDKLYFRSLTDSNVNLGRGDYQIFLTVDREARTLTVSDNGCGMSEEELETNLGTTPQKAPSTPTKPEQAKKGENMLRIMMAVEQSEMPDIDTDSYQEVWGRVKEYLKVCCKYDTRPSLPGLALSLGVTREILMGWLDGTIRKPREV